MNSQVQSSVIFQEDVVVPLANMFGYATDLRSNTQGRGTFSMEFQKYEQVPANIEKEIIEKAGASRG